MPVYAVCTRCTFLRAFSEHANAQAGACPACGGELVIERGASRFPPTYVAKVSQAIHSAELEAHSAPAPWHVRSVSDEAPAIDVTPELLDDSRAI